jgi:hypothetical protein
VAQYRFLVGGSWVVVGHFSCFSPPPLAYGFFGGVFFFTDGSFSTMEGRMG